MRAHRGGITSLRTWCTALAFSIFAFIGSRPAIAQQPAPDQPPAAAAADNKKGGEAGASAAPTAAATTNPATSPTGDTRVATDEGKTEGWWPRIESWLRDDAADVGKKVGLAFLFFIAGWLLAKFLAWLFFRLLCRTEWDERVFKRLGLTTMLQRDGAPPNQSERIMATVVFWMLMLIVVIATLQYAGLSQAAKPIQTFVDRIAAAMPLVGKAVLIMLAAYAAGLALGGLTTRFLDQSRIDDRFLQLTGDKPGEEEPAEAAEGTEAGKASRPFSEAAGRVVFWLMMVLGVAGAVDALKIGPLAHGLQSAIDQVVTRLPQVGLAALLLVSGYVLGRIARATVDNLLDSAGFNKLVEKAKLSKVFGERKPSDVAGIIAMVFIILQLAIAALKEVQLTTLSDPLTEMMAQFWNSLPSVALAAVIITAGVIGARIVRELVEAGLDNLGFSEWMDKLGVSAITERSERLQKPHQLIGLIVFIAIILLATVQALEKLELFRWAAYVNGFLTFSVARVAIALVIVGVGLGIANYVRDIILARRKDDADDAVRWMAMFARYGILVFAVCMGVSHLEIGDNFVIITFSLLFGSLCLALALSFGLGSRDVAGDIVRKQYNRAKRELAERAERPAKPSES